MPLAAIAVVLLLAGCLFPPPAYPEDTGLQDVDDEGSPRPTVEPDPDDATVERIVDRNVTLEGSIRDATVVEAQNDVVQPQVHQLELEPRLVGISVVVSLVDAPPGLAPGTDLDLWVNLTVEDPLGPNEVWVDKDVDGTVTEPDEPALYQRDRTVLERDVGSRLEITIEAKAAVDQDYRVLVSYRFVETAPA